jgi:hypothetical protein
MLRVSRSFGSTLLFCNIGNYILRVMQDPRFFLTPHVLWYTVFYAGSYGSVSTRTPKGYGFEGYR